MINAHSLSDTSDVSLYMAVSLTVGQIIIEYSNDIKACTDTC